jgi:hypothetical protein
MPTLAEQLRTANTHHIASDHYALLNAAADEIETLAAWLMSPWVHVHEHHIETVDLILAKHIGDPNG